MGWVGSHLFEFVHAMLTCLFFVDIDLELTVALYLDIYRV